MGTVTIRVFVEDPGQPTDLARMAIQRAQAAAARHEGHVQVCVLALDSPEATELAVSVEPTVAVDDLVLATGQAPPAGHILRAVTVAMEGRT